MRHLRHRWLFLAVVSLLSYAALTTMAQPEGERDGPRRGGDQEKQRPGPPRGGPAGGPGRGGFGPPPIMAALDLDKNGELSAEEIGAAAKSLRTLDRNDDGKLTREELFAGGPRPFGRERPGRPDGEGFGPPPRNSEGGRPPRPGFGPREGERGGPDGGPRAEGERPTSGPRPSGADFVARIREFDRNDDGKVDRDELPERMQRILDRADRNKDGALDSEELDQLGKGAPAGRGPAGGSRRGGPGEDEPAGGVRPRRPSFE